jgi:hypothetical protein
MKFNFSSFGVFGVPGGLNFSPAAPLALPAV